MKLVHMASGLAVAIALAACADKSAERLLARIRGESVTPKMLDLGFTLSPGGSI